MRCICCNGDLPSSVQKKKYLTYIGNSKKKQWITTDEDEDMCSHCRRPPECDYDDDFDISELGIDFTPKYF